MKFKSNRKQVRQRMDKAQNNMLEAVGKGAEGFVKLNTPVATGALRSSINYHTDKDGVYVGSTLMSEDYPIFVELGTSKMASQSYLKSGIMNNLAQLKKIAERNYKL
ncbi:HK97-gp10 family putative phage morphogenesis protein [Virgibacillus sp. W0430]|uniref:HK97-gp10 family putative phage morphogenesis protein n=1 Tax=Virgibacillus sp. W0430 TaxID=3391580 RepID=UPI003F4582F2